MVLDPMAASSPNSAENLLALLDASDVAVLRLDRSGRCTLLNRAAGALLGHPAEVLLGEPLHAVVHPHHAGRAAHEVPTCALERALLAGAALRADDRFQRADGSEIPVEYQINPITSDGRTTGLVVIVRDRGGRSDLDTRPTQSARLLTLRAELATAFSAAAGVDDLLQRCVGAFMRQLDIAFVRIWLYDPARQSLVLSASAGLPSRAEGDRGQVPWGAFTIGRIAEAREPYLTNDVGRESRSGADAWAAREGVVSFAGYPLLASQRLIGVLALFAREPIAEESLEELSRVAGAIAGGIEHRRTEGEQQRLVNQLQAQQARLRTMLQQMPSGILVADAPSGRITLGNDQVERILRHPIQYATGIADVHQERARRADGRVLAASEWPLARAIRGGEVTREEELEYLRGDGTRCWISVS
ncbi:MAG TPA: PAS domain-containing protein, partial [Thermomicrobiaceae bacterium]|nr:PAS domain-containing protein [Thermomicrobiaceae bacterium]